VISREVYLGFFKWFKKKLSTFQYFFVKGGDSWELG